LIHWIVSKLRDFINKRHGVQENLAELIGVTKSFLIRFNRRNEIPTVPKTSRFPVYEHLNDLPEIHVINSRSSWSSACAWIRAVVESALDADMSAEEFWMMIVVRVVVV